MSPLPPETIPRKRFLGFLIWQSIPSTLLFVSLNALFAVCSPRPTNPTSVSSRVVAFFTSVVMFQLSQLLFSASLSSLSTPSLSRPASPLELGFVLVRLAIGSQPPGPPPEGRRRMELSLSIAAFLGACAVSGAVSVVAVCWALGGGSFSVKVVGFRGFAVGLFYGLFYVYKQRWILKFPIIQRPLFFSFKMGVPSAIGIAFRLSAVAYVFSAVLLALVRLHFKIQMPGGRLMFERIIFFIGMFVVFLCWELSHHLHQALHTKRSIFAPPRGSAAAETNPSEPLLAALEESSPHSLVQYLAYLDLCMLCESNVDTWRRAAFFEETGETYKRVIAVCLRPLERLATKLTEGLESSSVDITLQQSNQLLLPSNGSQLELLKDYQLYAWSARTVASLTARSHSEDRFGIAQLSGSNASVVSTLLSCLLAVETFSGKRTHLQSSHQLVGPGGIRWAAPNTGRRDFPSSVMGKKRGSPLHSRAYAVADVLKVSLYQIVSAFYGEMQGAAKSGLLERDWIVSSKPIFGTREALLQKLRIFLDYKAS
ncbi:uncharacterized protein LOC116188498 [Punica granatum]|uniref:Nucleoporin NDC1 n=2 Tax=Punica granatum TaxID=22663 RepID=A0A218XE32_PUNGR|nr:uncharacterized protein LOC116188498 [Punica granatum]OWM82966.1 hypothetical protein CDL15_Pgr005366 [Punica granatum]PKI71747.1 hypothetical protein CRG98_007880 [Punica granatum]